MCISDLFTLLPPLLRLPHTLCNLHHKPSFAFLLCIEGRGLKATTTTKSAPKSVSAVKKMSTAPSTTKGVVAEPSQSESIAASLNGYVEAFRPTTPGHSPGVGHSINN
ncbi:unnamed protein product [Sphenostylis stenocarpa]|uniref:Uncharacterized protein n=1 Tax=Sphenostylis stenocarpa TaxID=92480 RepID=A0AA86S0M2_9FABA|nr:unnamed protein product [Sphenostylis stenocarpa]